MGKTGWVREYIDWMFTTSRSGLTHRFLTACQLPSQCHVCHAWPAAPVCEACVNRFAQPVNRCLTCAVPLPAPAQHCGACLKNLPPLDQCLAAVAYGFPWSALIQSYKFHDQTGLARSFALLLRATPWVDDALAAADLLLPMPLSRERLQARGYNQAQLLAQHLEPNKVRADLLLKLRDTPAQHTLKRAQRLVALDHAFAKEPLRASALVGKTVVVVDDVMTTGASMFSAARVLKDAGARRVIGLVLARTE